MASSTAELEYVAGQNLRASHEIINLLERAKFNSDSLINRLPDLYLIIDSSAVIWRGNEVSARLLQVGTEELAKLPLSRMFKPETWKIMKAKVQALVDANDGKEMEFELPLDATEQGSREYFWNIRFYEVNLPKNQKLICVLGRDISQIRQYQRQMTQIFLSIPLGIITMDKEGMIAGPCSAFTEHLLGKSNLTGQSLKKLLFEQNLEKSKVDTIFAGFGCEDFWFQSMKPHFPSEAPYDLTTSEGTERRWLGISYHPIFHGEMVEKLLVILEDRTEIIKTRHAKEETVGREEGMVNRILEVSRCDEELLAISSSELEALFLRMDEDFRNGNQKRVATTLHTVKGVSRTCGFTRLKNLIHEFEDLILKDQEGKACQEPWAKNRYLEIKLEYQEIANLFRVFSGRLSGADVVVDNTAILNEISEKVLKPMEAFKDQVPAGLLSIFESLKKITNSAGKSSLQDLEKSLMSRAAKTMERLEKKVHLEITSTADFVPTKIYQGLSEGVLHLLNNALDHAIEPAEEREILGKKSEGTIKVDFTVMGNMVKCSVSDDGKGLSPEGLRRAAVRKGVITEAEAAEISDENALYLITRTGFSTASMVSDVSGRGIGLDAVVDTIVSLGGDRLEIASRLGQGTTFSFSLPISA